LQDLTAFCSAIVAAEQQLCGGGSLFIFICINVIFLLLLRLCRACLVINFKTYFSLIQYEKRGQNPVFIRSILN